MDPTWTGVVVTIVIVLVSVIYQHGKHSQVVEDSKSFRTQVNDDFTELSSTVGRIDRTVSRIQGHLGINGTSDDRDVR